MDDNLRLDADERRALVLRSLEALERLRGTRAAADIHVPADPAVVDLARAAPPVHGTGLDGILDRYVRIAAAGWDKTAGGNVSYIPNGALDAGTVAALLAAGAHSFTGASFEAPAMVAMEEGILRWMADLFGLPAGAGGVLLSGGSLANQTAIVAARARARAAVHEREQTAAPRPDRPPGARDPARAADPAVATDPVAATDPAVATDPVAATNPADATETMYASERVHHSVTKAAHLVGIPAGAIRTVATDDEGRCDPGALAALVDADVAAGRRPFLVVGVAGSTDTGSVDPLDRLADVAARVGAWLHVDAAYGGFFTLTRRGRDRLRGIERADSVTVDAHKGLFLPYGVGALLVRDPAHLVAAHEGWGAYLRGVPSTAGLPHYFQRGPELTRPSRAVLVWFPLQLHGTAAFARELDRMLDLAALAHRRLAGIPGIVVGPPPATSIVTFRAAAGDRATDAIVDALHATRRFQVSTTTIAGRATIRFAFLSPATTEALVAEAIEVVAATVDGA
jgi:aromatic-L-amino-acid decarboxylase